MTQTVPGRRGRPAAATREAALALATERFLYSDAIVGIRGDTQRLREIEAALLGVG